MGQATRLARGLEAVKALNEDTSKAVPDYPAHEREIASVR
jgi:hypothetical protein